MAEQPNPPWTPPPEAITPANPMALPVPSGAIAPGPPPPAVPPTPAASEPAPPAAKNVKAAPPHDSFREFLETIVFVVVLVLILKTFLAEAFVIPTGSMATTLLGYHKEVTCQQCGYRFLVNASVEADPAEMRHEAVTGATCPNCFFHNDLRPPHLRKGEMP